MRYVMVTLLALGCVTARAAPVNPAPRFPACVYGAWDDIVETAAGWKFVALYGGELQAAITVAERDAGLMRGVTARAYALARMVPGNSGQMQFEVDFLDKDGCFRLRRTTNDHDEYLSFFDDGSI